MTEWSTACLDWRERIVAKRSLIPFDPLFPDEAEAALSVFKSLRIVDVAGQPTFGEACEEYVFDFVRAIFGAYDHESATRLIEEFFLLISKKNIKSTLAAGIMLTALIRNWRHSQELVILAPTREVADNSYKPAAAMVRADEELSDLLHIRDDLKQITHRLTNAVLKVISADSTTSAGKKAGFILVEELWLFGQKANAAAMLQEATGGLISRPEGFVIYITTQSDKPPAGVFKEKMDYARDVRDGKIVDPRFLPVLYEFPEEMVKSKAYLEPANFYVTNPNMGRSVRQDWLERKLAAVLSGQDEEGDTIQTFLAKHLNIEIGMNLRANRWPGADHWTKGRHPELAEIYERSPFDALYALLDRVECATIGGDGGGLDDLWGLTILGREPAEIEVEIEIAGRKSVQKMKRWLSWSHAWCHEGVLIRRKSIASKLRDFEKAGELTIVGDELSDLGSIIELIKLVKERQLLGGVGVDPAGLGEFVDALAAPDIDVTDDNALLRGVPQGFGMMNAIKTTERRLAKGLLQHCGGLLMPWCVSNLKIEPTATAIRATKQVAGDNKIDPAMSLFDAATVMLTNPEPAGFVDVMAMVA
ncbi:terminase large subunit [Mesorhizobium sp. YM1C-6-2]|uniref:terminase large subunit n=1 Tax=Mesorhizobium sp. YM1C-6-2 TaxID=1827501 RepID=UPI000EF1B85A|nr:terminase large subunit [Mesorhizobium sp. YM1C-6-2]RLP22255.1 terminase large subunit [Mesorhizobium sp. YM1C-6-2]